MPRPCDSPSTGHRAPPPPRWRARVAVVRQARMLHPPRRRLACRPGRQRGGPWSRGGLRCRGAVAAGMPPARAVCLLCLLTGTMPPADTRRTCGPSTRPCTAHAVAMTTQCTTPGGSRPLASSEERGVGHRRASSHAAPTPLCCVHSSQRKSRRRGQPPPRGAGATPSPLPSQRPHAAQKRCAKAVNFGLFLFITLLHLFVYAQAACVAC